MERATRTFLIVVATLTVLCALLQYAWNSQMPEVLRLQHGPFLLALFAGSVTAIHLFLLRSADSNGAAFIRKFLASTVLKFFLYIIILLAFLLFTTGDKRVLILHFLFYYAVFTSVEIGMLYNQLRRTKK